MQKLESIYELIVTYRNKARYTINRAESCAAVSERLPCSDLKFLGFVRDLYQGKDRVEIILSKFRWKIHVEHAGNILYPVKAVANRLSDGSYTIDVTGFNIDVCYSYEGVC